MKSAISFILSSIIFLASFQNSLFYVDYQINTEFYETYCINKQKPEYIVLGKGMLSYYANDFNQGKNTFKK
jgi:hypothetical protein